MPPGEVLQALASVLAMICVLLVYSQRRSQKRSRERAKDLLAELEDGRTSYRELKFRSDAQGVLTEASNRFLRSDRSMVERCMQTTLHELGEFLAVKRVSLFRFDIDGGSVTHRWIEGSQLRRNDGEGFLPTPQIEAVVREGNPVRYGSVDQVPEEAKELRAFLHRRGTRAMLAVPIARHGDENTLGFLLLEVSRSDRAWMDEEVRIVGAIAELFAFELTFRHTEGLARARQQQLDEVMNLAPVAMLVVDANSVVRFAEGSALRDSGVEPKEMLGKSALELTAEMPAAQEMLRRGLAGEEFRNELRVGGRVLDVRARPAQDEAVAGGTLLLLATDITARVQAEEDLARGKLHEPVTGLPNRILLLEQMHDHLGADFSLLLIGLDRWGPLQDALGLNTAADYMRAAAAALRESVPNATHLARVEPDVFGLVLPREIADVTAAALQSLFQNGIQVDGRRQTSGVSIGSSLANEGESSADGWLLRAHTAMLAARQRGGGCAASWKPQMHTHLQATWKLEEELAEAIEGDHLEAWMQPIVDLETRRPVAFEALARWPHPREGMMQPGHFIPLAEENGMISAIGWSMLNKACAELASAIEGRPELADIYVSVNVSSRQFTVPDFMDRVHKVLAEYELQPGNLQLEITESDAVGPNEDIIPLLDAVRAAGVRVSIDDFGTGYSSLSYLNRLPADSMKVDRSFVVHMGTAAAGRKVITSILLLAQGLSLTAIAEGIETEEQRQQLLALGCPYGQGFLFCRPLPPGEARAWLSKGQRETAATSSSS